MIPDTSGVPDTISQREDAISGFKSVQWEELERAGAFINANDVRTLQDLEQYGMEGVSEDEQAVAQTVSTLIKVLKNITTNEGAIHYALVRIDDFLAANVKGRYGLFLQESEGAGPAAEAGSIVDPSPFMRLVINGSSFSQKLASGILARLYSVKVEGSETFMNWIVEQLRQAPSSPGSCKLAVSALALLLRSLHARTRFHAAGGLPLLSAALSDTSPRSAAANAQFQYEGCFCLWTLSLCPAALPHFLQAGALNALCQQVSLAPREKVIRVAISALRNAVASGDSDVVQALIGRGLGTSLQHLAGRQWTDADISPDVEIVRAELLRNYRSLTTLERYEAEVDTGLLSWGILHDPNFFQDNVRLMEAQDFAVIKKLIALLSSERTETVAVACHDIGEFCRFYPNGKSIIGHLNGKPLVMALLAHPDPEVQRRALACISKLMLQSGHAEAVTKNK